MSQHHPWSLKAPTTTKTACTKTENFPILLLTISMISLVFPWFRLWYPSHLLLRLVARIFLLSIAYSVLLQAGFRHGSKVTGNNTGLVWGLVSLAWLGWAFIGIISFLFTPSPRRIIYAYLTHYYLIPHAHISGWPLCCFCPVHLLTAFIWSFSSGILWYSLPTFNNLLYSSPTHQIVRYLVRYTNLLLLFNLFSTCCVCRAGSCWYCSRGWISMWDIVEPFLVFMYMRMHVEERDRML